MIRKLTVLVLVFILHGGIFAQTISGNLSLLVKQKIRLEGFNGLKTYPISSTTIDEKGKFQLSYSKLDYGVGYLISEDNKPLIVILSSENIEVSGEALSYIETIKVIKGQENKWFEQYAKEHPRREQALSAWIYLEKIYAQDSLFLNHKKVNPSIQKEKKRIMDEDANYLKNLPNDSYVSWFLPTRKLVSSVSAVAQYRTEEISSTVAAFRNLDYTDQRLYKSGLFKDAIENHFWLLENSGKSTEVVFEEMKISIDSMMKHLVNDEKKLNEVTDHLFLFLESRSLFQASEYLALKVLNEVSCTIDNDLVNQLETYRVMKIGNTAPDIVFEGKNMMMGNQLSKELKLSDLKSNYTLVVFGASWCSNCAEEIPRINEKYIQWKLKGLETVFISLDNDEKEFTNFVKNFSFLSSSDFKGWKSKAAQDYHVFAAPTLFLLDKERKILLRPRSGDQVDTWVNYKLDSKN